MTKHYPASRGEIFDSKSPFRQVPINLDTTQRLFLDGIRFAVEMAQLSHVRLRGLLTVASTRKDGESMPEGFVTQGFLDAWSLVDSIHRLRELLSAMPGMKKRGHMLDVFMRGTKDVEVLRNRIQHLRGDLANRSLSNLPVWGTISWLWVSNEQLTHFISGVITAGTEAQNVRLILTPNDREYHDQLDHITLSSGVVSFNLSAAMRLVVRISRTIEQELSQQLSDTQSAAPTDLVFLFEIELPPS